MNAPFSGRVTYANDVSAPNVQVRVFEPGGQGQAGTDLTVTPGVSDLYGNFTVTYHSPSLDFLNSLFSMNPAGNPPSHPYLQFAYTLNGQACLSTSTLALFETVFALPDFSPQKFIPSINGFNFDNDFPGFPVPAIIHLRFGLPDITPDYGLCGGMSSTAYDFFLAGSGRTIPSTDTVPGLGTPLHSYLVKRSIDTFGIVNNSPLSISPWNTPLGKVAQMTLMPDTGPDGIQKQNVKEYIAIKKVLDSSRLVVMGLIYQSASTPTDLLNNIWNNHQVLALNHTDHPDGTSDIQIYDPNCHGRDDVFIHLSLVSVSAGQSGLICTQVVGGNPLTDRNVRGITSMAYQYHEPWPGL